MQDTISPELTVIPNKITIEKDTNWDIMQGVKATDNIDGDITASVTYTGNLNVGLQGTYTIEYTVVDNSGNVGNTAKRTVVVTDYTPPTIKLDSSNVYTAEVYTAVPSINATVTDKNNSPVTNIVVDYSSINMNVIGKYPVTITATDEYGAIAQTTVTINVVHTTKPIITLVNEGIDILIEVEQETYLDPGYSAYSNYYGDITGDVVVNGVVNTNQTGTYTLTYTVKDASNNLADIKTRTIKVVDTVKPTLTILGENPVTLELGDTFIDAGVLALDNYDQNIQSKVTTINTVDNMQVGSYEVKYNVTDNFRKHCR